MHAAYLTCISAIHGAGVETSLKVGLVEALNRTYGSTAVGNATCTPTINSAWFKPVVITSPGRCLCCLTMQELQRASQDSAVNAASMQQMQQDLAQLAQSQQKLQAQQDACHSSTSSSSRKLQEVSQQLQQLGMGLTAQSSDLTGLAESVLSCLAAARAHAAAAAASASQPASSYLSNLLGPAAQPAAAVSANKQLPWGAWVSAAADTMNNLPCSTQAVQTVRTPEVSCMMPPVAAMLYSPGPLPHIKAAVACNFQKVHAGFVTAHHQISGH
jgi:hypothetical protein